jgi:hypothetical protein
MDWKAPTLTRLSSNTTSILRALAFAMVLAAGPCGGTSWATMLDDNRELLDATGTADLLGTADEAFAAAIAAELESAHQTSPAALSDGDAPKAEPSSPVCAKLARSAIDNDVPLAFFTRLIWQESRFDPRSVSRAGARGIAQLMPGTARMLGVTNPFNPDEALPKSAKLLRDLINRFGNPGLAAAAYNAGPGRVIAWLAGRKELPHETVAYVRIVTGREAVDWVAPGAAESDDVAEVDSCDKLAGVAAAEHRHVATARARAAEVARAEGVHAAQTAHTGARGPRQTAAKPAATKKSAAAKQAKTKAAVANRSEHHGHPAHVARARPARSHHA